MIETMIICGVWGVLCAIASKVYIERKKREIERNAITGAVESYTKGLKRFVDCSAEKCPKCAHSQDGYICKNVDVGNFVRYGICTNFEEKRF